MTFYFTLALEGLVNPTYAQLIESVQDLMAGRPSKALAAAFQKAQRNYMDISTHTAWAENSFDQAHAHRRSIFKFESFRQRPQLSCSEPHDVNAPFIV